MRIKSLAFYLAFVQAQEGIFGISGTMREDDLVQYYINATEWHTCHNIEDPITKWKNRTFTAGINAICIMFSSNDCQKYLAMGMGSGTLATTIQSRQGRQTPMESYGISMNSFCCRPYEEDFAPGDWQC